MKKNYKKLLKQFLMSTSSLVLVSGFLNANPNCNVVDPISWDMLAKINNKDEYKNNITHTSSSVIVNNTSGHKSTILSGLPSFKQTNSKRIKIATASLNQIAGNLETNVKNIMTAIEEAVKQNVDVLAFPELTLNGYGCEDYFMWTNDVDILRQIHHIATAAGKINSNLVISLGAALRFQPNVENDLKSPFYQYNIDNKPYDFQMLITGGKVVSMSGKSVLANSQIEYETRNLAQYPEDAPEQLFDFPTFKGKEGYLVPCGKPITLVGNKKDGYISIYHEICAEAWVGQGDDLTVNEDARNTRKMIKLANDNVLSLVLNPSASRPQIYLDKENIRAKIAADSSNHVGAYVYTATLGSDSSVTANEGSQIFAQGGEIIGHGKRDSHKNVNFNSMTIDVPMVDDQTHSKNNSALAEHKFGHINSELSKGLDEDTLWKKLRERFSDSKTPEEIKKIIQNEEYVRTIALWARDYLAKQTFYPQGYLISLSGGADSGISAVILTTMVDLGIKEEGVNGFLAHFPKIEARMKKIPDYQQAKEAYEQDPTNEEKIEKVAKVIKDNMFIFIYMPTEQSSDTTRDAARTLIEGGTINIKHPNGKVEHKEVKGIGGKFEIHSVEDVYYSYMKSFAGLNVKEVIEDIKKSEDLPENIEYFFENDNFLSDFYQSSIESIYQDIQYIDSIDSNIKNKYDEDLQKIRNRYEDRKKSRSRIKTKKQIIDLQSIDSLKQLLTEEIKSCQLKLKRLDSDLSTLLTAHVDEILKNYHKNGGKLPDFITKNCNRNYLTWHNADTNERLTLENLQARIRLPLPWAIAQMENSMAVVTSNATEAAVGYSSAGGDSHMGGFNLIGGFQKYDINKTIEYMYEYGLFGLKKVESLYKIMVQKPTAELRLNNNDEVKQTDESDLKLKYKHLKDVQDQICGKTQTPKQAYDFLKNTDFTTEQDIDYGDGSLYHKDSRITARNKIAKFCYLWKAAQFKRYMATVSCSTGSSVDQHNIRTHIVGDHFRIQVAMLSLDVLNEIHSLWTPDKLEEVKGFVERNLSLSCLAKLEWSLTDLFSADDNIAKDAARKLANDIAELYLLEQNHIEKLAQENHEKWFSSNSIVVPMDIVG